MHRLYNAKWQWLIAFAYALVAMYAMRRQVIPMMAPHEGGNLGGDPLYYHHLAMELAGRIRAQGMGAWALHVDGQGPAGVMALIYLVARPQIGIVALNAALHATAGLMIILILRRFFSPAVAVLSAMPFVVSLHQMFWFSQVNKDSFVASGFMLFAYGLLRITRRIAGTPTRKDLLEFILLSGGGAVLIYIGRPFIVFLLQHFAIAILLATLAIAAIDRSGNSLIQRASYTILCCLFLLSLSPLTVGAASDQTLTEFASAETSGHSQDSVPPDPAPHDSLSRYPVAHACLERSFYGWEESVHVSPGLNARLRALFSQRCLYFIQLYDPNPTTRSAVVDADVFPGSPADALRYLPKAALNGFLAPYPTTAAPHFGTSTFFTIATLEVAAFALTIPFLIGWLLRDRSNAAVLAPLALSAGVVLIYGMGVPFVGALYRYRYPFWMLVFCIGLAATLDLFDSRLKGRHRQDVV